MNKKIMCAVLAMAMILSMALCLLPGNVQAAEENVLYSQDFSQGADESLKGVMSVANGEATITATDMITLPLSGLAESNNYEVSFKLKLQGASNVFVHMIGLDATNNGNIYMDVIAQGTYLRISDFVGHDVYNNSGDLHGGLDWAPVALENGFAEFRFVHYEGYLELWVNGTRRAVTHLSNFGNNNYCVNGRTELTEGTITGIGIHVPNANCAVFDDIKVIEAKPAATEYFEQSNGAGDKIFPLSAQNLYHDNFEILGTFDVSSAENSGWPAFKLLGLNGSLTSQNGKEYAINVQAEAKGNTINPAIFGQPEGPDAWVGRNGEDIAITPGTQVKYCIQVLGDKIKFYINDALAVETTFTDMGLTKGHLQYIKAQNGNGITWNSFSYRGAATEEEILNPTPDVPAAGDSSFLPLAMVMLAVSAVGCAVILTKKESIVR